jgi:hypothetical protein
MIKLIKDNILGIIGLIALCVAIPLPEGSIKNILNIVGFLGLISYAKLGKNDLFFYAELVALLGYIVNIVGINNSIKYPVMIVVSLAALIKILSNADYRKLYTIFGFIGLGGLVYGYLAYSNVGYAVGGVGMAIYSLIGFFQGFRVALIFFILNVIYGGVSIYMLLAQ